MFRRKPFPAKVNWRAFWKHRWLVLNILNQIAYGSQSHAVETVRSYGGADFVGQALWAASREIIRTKPEAN
jgi:hypothetical protein